MPVEIITQPLHLNIFGFSGIAANKDYAGTAFQLSGRMWDAVRSHNIKNKGKNIWVYDSSDRVFAGIELEEGADPRGLEKLEVRLGKYAYHKHTGSYNLIKQAGRNMTEELKAKGLETALPYIEIYGHWNKDESKLETELFMSLK